MRKYRNIKANLQPKRILKYSEEWIQYRKSRGSNSIKVDHCDVDADGFEDAIVRDWRSPALKKLQTCELTVPKYGPTEVLTEVKPSKPGAVTGLTATSQLPTPGAITGLTATLQQIPVPGAITGLTATAQLPTPGAVTGLTATTVWNPSVIPNTTFVGSYTAMDANGFVDAGFTDAFGSSITTGDPYSWVNIGSSMSLYSGGSRPGPSITPGSPYGLKFESVNHDTGFANSARTSGLASSGTLIMAVSADSLADSPLATIACHANYTHGQLQLRFSSGNLIAEIYDDNISGLQTLQGSSVGTNGNALGITLIAFSYNYGGSTKLDINGGSITASGTLGSAGSDFTALNSTGFAERADRYCGDYPSVLRPLNVLNRQSTTYGSFTLHEVALINDSSTATVQTFEGYLAHKWGVTGNLPAGHPYKTTAP